MQTSLSIGQILYRIDEVFAPYSLLVSVLGESVVGDPDKTLAEWFVLTPFGWAEVYDYKSYADSVHDVEVWHLQADTEEAYDWIHEQVESARGAT